MITALIRPSQVIIALFALTISRQERPTPNRFLLTLFALRAAQPAHREISRYSIQQHPPVPIDDAGRELSEAVAALPVRVSSARVADTLQLSVAAEDSASIEDREFARRAILRLAATLTDNGLYALDSVRVRVWAEDGQLGTSGADFLAWREQFDIDESMSIFPPVRPVAGSRVLDVVFGRHSIRDGIFVVVPFP